MIFPKSYWLMVLLCWSYYLGSAPPSGTGRENQTTGRVVWASYKCILMYSPLLCISISALIDWLGWFSAAASALCLCLLYCSYWLSHSPLLYTYMYILSTTNWAFTEYLRCIQTLLKIPGRMATLLPEVWPCAALPSSQSPVRLGELSWHNMKYGKVKEVSLL